MSTDAWSGERQTARPATWAVPETAVPEFRDGSAPQDDGVQGVPVWFRPPGRPRKPRPRKALFAVGGLALAAGVLSFVRPAPDVSVGGSGTAEAEPRLDDADTASK